MRLSLLLAAVLAVAVLGPPAAAAGSTDVVDLTFPTERGVEFSDTFDDGRSGGRVHKATDLLGEQMLEIYAAVGGTVSWIPGAEGEGQPSYGYMISIDGDDGRSYSYVHLNNDTPGTDDGAGGPENAYAPGLAKGSRVERGQLIGWMGDSGNSEGTTHHLHFSIEDPEVSDPYGTSFVNPYESLNDALERGDVVGGSQDGSDGSGEGEDGEEGRDDDDDEGEDAGEEPQESSAQEPPAERVAGADRIGTSVALSSEAFSTAEHVVIAPGFSFAEAIIAGPLGSALGGPVLSSADDALDERVRDELDRLEATHVTIVGGTALVGREVEQALADQGLQVDRIAGDDESATAALVAERVWVLRGEEPGNRRALVALGSHPEPVKAWPDALAAGWQGAVSGRPVLLVRSDSPTQVTLDALDGVADAKIVGGTAAISAETEGLIAERADTVHRLAGNDRFGTAVAVARDLDTMAQPPSKSDVWLATGYGFADALTAAAAVAHTGQTFLLLDGEAGGADDALDPWLDEYAGEVDELRPLGGEQVVTGDAVEGVQQRLR